MEPTTNIDRTTADELGELSAQSVYAFPMSFAQQRLWFLNQFEPESTLYNIVWPIRLHGRLNVEALEKSLNEIVRRHEVLRATFKTINDQPVQVIAPSVVIPLAIKNLTDLSQDQQRQEVQRLIAAEAETPINLQTGPMIRAQLAYLADEEHAFLLTLHHIVSDRWSRGLFFRELAALYEAFSQGHRSLLPELPLQYTDFSVWQRQWLNGENLEKQLSYWKQQLAGAPSTLELPTDHPRPAARSFHGRVYSFQLASDLVEDLKALSRREGVTLFMLLLAGLQTLLARYSGQEDIVVGTPIANRNRAEIENLIGFFANTLPLRTNFSDDPTFRELLARVRDLTLGAYAHQDLPFEKLVEELNPERSQSHNPIVQVLFALQNAPMQELRLAGLTVESIATQSEGSKFDLSLFLTEAHNAIQCRLEYNTDLFRESTAARMMAHFQTLLREVVANPEQRVSEYELLTNPERQQVLVEWNDTAADFPAVCIHDLFQQQTIKSPDSVAVRFGNLSMTYAELNHRSNQLANYLRGRGVSAETLIGLYLDRSLDMMVALLGILKAGAAYVPLDPVYPKERIAFIVEDSGVSVLITQEHLINSLPAHSATVVAIDKEWDEISKESAANLSLDITPENLAYLLYTSGSTGKPKGVQIEHRAVVNFLAAMRQQPGLTERDILLAVTTLSFDIAGLELYLPLVCGAQVVLADREQAANGKELLRLMQESQATAMQATPATWRLLLDSGWTGNPKLKALCGGEALPRSLAEQLRPLCGELWNMYGPTETT
ncbi:MAG: non-ribosomal peptide synthetase, partial [Acidobacteria bacterium]